MNNFPTYISVTFFCTTILTIWLFWRATNYAKSVILVLFFWIIFQSLVGLSGFYENFNAFPPRFLLLIAPPFLFIILLFNFSKGQKFIDNLSIEKLTMLHIVRIPVEIVLFWLFLQKAIPQLMTFEGRNFDILAGISAPIIYYFVFIKQSFNQKVLLLWNSICLILLANIVINALLSAPLPFQQFAFEQPNMAIIYFPFNLLPSVVVPLVLLAHLAAIRQIISKK
jgi:hypothetical protein